MKFARMLLSHLWWCCVLGPLTIFLLAIGGEAGAEAAVEILNSTRLKRD